MIWLPNYGLHHLEGGINILIQGGDEVQHLLGIEIDLPVRVRRPQNSIDCGHNINLHLEPGDAERDFWAMYGEDPVVQAFAPLPRGDHAPIFLPDTLATRAFVREMLRLSSTTWTPSPMHPLWMITAKRIMASQRSTNVQPMLLEAVDVHYKMARQIVSSSYHHERQLILLGGPFTPHFEGVQRCSIPPVPVSQLQQLNLQALGSSLLRQRMTSMT